MEYLATVKGETALPKSWLWKSHADQHDVPPEARAHKPVLLSPVKAKHFELVGDGGAVVGKSGGPQPFEDGRWRYYFPKFGYELPGRYELRAGGKVFGVINPGFREGEFRNGEKR
jgi:hypothetical protein